MILSVSEQVIVFLTTAISGMVIALVYDLFRIFRKTVRTGSLVTFVQDILYWLIASVIMFVTIYYSNDGELRGFLFLGAFLGVIIYALLFSKVIMDSSMFIIRITSKTVRFAAFVVSYPFRLIMKLIILPVFKIARETAASMKKARAERKAKTDGQRHARNIYVKVRQKILTAKKQKTSKRREKNGKPGKCKEMQQ